MVMGALPTMIGWAVASEADGVRWTEFRGRGFWSRDGLLEVWLAVLVDELDRRVDGAPWMKSMRDAWLASANVSFNGLVSTELDAHIDSEAKREVAIALCRDVRRRLDKEGADPGSMAAAFGTHARRVGGTRWQRRDTAKGLLRVADSFLWLLEDAA